jgi:alpha-N-acetylglucosamine transferase
VTKGFLYIAFGNKYLQEVEISARSLKRFTKFSVCVITDDATFSSSYIDEIIIAETMTGFTSKIIGLAKTPFEQTVFLDSDTFVCAQIDQLFDILDLFDMAMAVERNNHSYSFIAKYKPDFKISYENVFPEYNTGVIVYKENAAVKGLLSDWLEMHNTLQFKADMPSFRETFMQHIGKVNIASLPFEYNYFGTHSFGFAHSEIKVIHERFGEKWNTLTRVMLPYEKMEKKAKRMNKYHCKRIIVPYFGAVPYTWSPYRLKYKLKTFFGIKKSKKSETF